MKKLLNKLKVKHPDIAFEEGDYFYWSPQKKTITYTQDAEKGKQEITLLHELAHAILGHSTFNTDFELLQMEVDAWKIAQKLGNTYKVSIPEGHIDKCLDTYRDWLHLRSTCPNCSNNGIQSLAKTYSCINCPTTWRVSNSRLCRPYRQVTKQKALH